jgi:hypothetical protein
MKYFKRFLTIIIFYNSISNCTAQITPITISFEMDTIKLKSDNNISKDFYFGVNIQGILDTSATVMATVELSKSSSIPLNAILFNTTILTFKKINMGTQYVKLTFSTDLKDIENKTIEFELKTIGKANNININKQKLIIQIVAPEYKTDFVRLFTGTNLDLLNTNSIKFSFYGEFDYFNPHLISDRLGIFGGVYQSKANSPDTLNSGIANTSFYTKSNDTLYNIIEYSYNGKMVSSIKSAGFFLNPVFTLFNKEKGKQKYKFTRFVSNNFYPSQGTQFLGQFHFEYVKRTFESRRLVTNLTYKDTTISRTRPNSSSEIATNGYGFESRNEFYYGLGFLINHNSSDFNLKLSTTFGILSSPVMASKVRDPLNLPNFTNSEYLYAPFFNLRFNATFLPLGIDIGGEVRSILKTFKDDIYPQNPSQVFYTLYLSKVFNMKKIGEYLKVD